MVEHKAGGRLRHLIQVDNVLNPMLYNHIFDTLTSHNVSWNMTHNISTSDVSKHLKASGSAEQTVPMYGFGFNFFNINHGIMSRVDYEMFYPVLSNALHQADIEMEMLLLGRAFLTLPPARRPNAADGAHRDVDEPHMVCLYYVTDHENDPDASTIFFKSKDDLSVVHRQPAKANTAVIFDGSQYHMGGYPTKERRVIINFTFKPMERG